MSLTETTKTVYDLVKKGASIELQEKLMQLREQALELQDENLRLEQENRKLRKQIELQETMTFTRKVYWRAGDKVPHCPYCYEERKSPIHLTVFQQNDAGQVYFCNPCQTRYLDNPEGDFDLWTGRRLDVR